MLYKHFYLHYTFHYKCVLLITYNPDNIIKKSLSFREVSILGSDCIVIHSEPKIETLDEILSNQLHFECNMSASIGQRYPSCKKYLVYSVAPCSTTHGHISFKWYVLIFMQWLFNRFSPHLIYIMHMLCFKQRQHWVIDSNENCFFFIAMAIPKLTFIKLLKHAINRIYKNKSN